MTTVIDVHTHMMPLPYIEALRQHGGEKYTVKKTAAGQDTIHLYGAPFTTLMPGMWDYEARIRAMDEARVDLAIVSLTCPNVYWGSRETSIATAVMVNDSMAEQQRARPGRIRWFASLPWQHADAAVAELPGFIGGPLERALQCWRLFCLGVTHGRSLPAGPGQAGGADSIVQAWHERERHCRRALRSRPWSSLRRTSVRLPRDSCGKLSISYPWGLRNRAPKTRPNACANGEKSCWFGFPADD